MRIESTVFVAKHKDDNIRMQSRSGGIFVAVSDYFIDNNGSVYGCVLDDDFTARHIRATDKETRNRMCKVKYVQSEMGDTINNIKKDLENGKMVLFSGTGCQAAGVLSALRTMHAPLESFFSIDIICHGVASPKVFEDYLNFLRRKHNSNIDSFEFRDKTLRGWDEYVESYSVKGKKIPSRMWREIYHKDLCNRPSCYKCLYCKVDRMTDLTIGDAWGVKKAKPEFNDNRGVSLVIPHGEKGIQLMNVVKEHCEVEKVDLEQMLQQNLQRPSSPKGNREIFWDDYRNGGIELVIKKYGKLPVKKLIYGEIKYLLRKICQSKRYYLP